VQWLCESKSFDQMDYSFVEGKWMVGVIDEVRMPLTENDLNPILIEIKTHSRDTLPSELQ